MSEWHPISTAPNQTDILIYLNNDRYGARIWIAYQSNLGGWCSRGAGNDDDDGFYLEDNIGASHWMLLPEPPK